MASLGTGFFPICEHSHAVLIVSLAFTVVAMLLAMWKKTRPSVYCMFVSILLQAVIASYPTCASVVDLHGPSIGNISTPRAANEARTENYFGRKTN
jgi:L-lactate permease